jgi:hypothetical protein
MAGANLANTPIAVALYDGALETEGTATPGFRASFSCVDENMAECQQGGRVARTDARRHRGQTANPTVYGLRNAM